VTDAPETIAAGRRVDSGVLTIVGRAGHLVSLVFLVLVAFCLIAPLVQTLYPIFGTIVAPVEERRAASPPPSPRLLMRANGDFAAGLNAWFDDRVGLRDLFIRAKNQIDYSIFRTSRKVYVGSDGWLFDPAGGALELARLDAAQLGVLEGRFVALARSLRERGVRLVVVGYPDKARIYPEMLPWAPVIPADGNEDRLRQFLAGQPSLIFVDAQEILEREKTRTTEPLFNKTDLHVNQVGQLPIVKEIIARIADAEARPEIRWDEKFELVHGETTGGSEARFLSLLFPRKAETSYYKEYYSIGRSEPDGAWTLAEPDIAERTGYTMNHPFDWAFQSLPEFCAQRLPGMVLFGNSFSDAYWALGLHRYFCFIRRAREPISRFKWFVDTMPTGTKYFIFQYYAPLLMEMVPPVD